MKIALIFVIVFSVSSLTAAGQNPPLFKTVQPSVTDPDINTFDTAHGVYFNPSAKIRNQLVVFIPGTNGTGLGGKLFAEVAANEGFHVISLSYPSAVAATICHSQADANCFANFRREIIEGRDLSPLIAVNRANSIENRLQKLLVYLKNKYESERWDEYLTAAGDIRWERLILSGQSQGGGHAPLMAQAYQVARVIMFSAPKDYDRQNNKPANWYGEGKTPLKNHFAFNHLQDKQGCDYDQQLDNLRSLGLFAFGEPVDVDQNGPPFKNSRILITDYPGRPLSSVEAHTSLMSDGRTPLDKDGVPHFKPVWIYLLTAD
jgi:dienelactone hydrolase